MGMIERISQMKKEMRKKQDYKLAMKSKAAKDEIRRQKFIAKSRKDIQKAKDLKKENSLLTRFSKKAKAVQESVKKYKPKTSTRTKNVGFEKNSNDYSIKKSGGKSPFEM